MQKKRKTVLKFGIGDVVTIDGWKDHHWRITAANSQTKRYQLERITLRSGERVAVPVPERELTMVRKSNGLKHAIWRTGEANDDTVSELS